MRRSAIRFALLTALAAPSPLDAQVINWVLLPRQHPPFAQIVAVLHPEYRFQYERERTRRLADLYLLSAVPVIPNTGAPPPPDTYFAVERPTAGLVTSFLYEQPLEPVPVEDVLVFARLLRPGTLSFRCELFTATGPQKAVCRGTFEINSGSLHVEYLDLLLDKTEDRLRKQPEPSCVNRLYEVERSQSDCGSFDTVNNFGCWVAAFLYARHRCRTAEF